MENVMNIKKLLMVGLISVAAITSTSTLAKPNKNDINIYRMMLSERGIQKLDLTTEQVEQIKGLYDAEKKATSALKLKTNQHKDTMKLLMQAEFFDREAYLEAVNEGQSDRADLLVLKASNKHQMRNILTLEQKEKLNKFKHKKRKKMKKRARHNAD
jgi:protein CpxP